MAVVLTIDSVDRSSFLTDYISEQTVEWYTDLATIYLYDGDTTTLRDSLSKYLDVKITEDGLDVFRGVITSIDKEPNDTATFTVDAWDYWIYFINKHITRTFTDMTSSEIIKDIIDTYFSSIFTYTNVATTSTDRTYRLRGRNASDFLQELASKEGFVIYIDIDNDIHFKAENAENTGLSYDYAAGDLWDESFSEIGRDIVNAVFVEGQGGNPALGGTNGVGAYVIDPELLDECNGVILEMPKIYDATLQTVSECRDRGEYEIRRRNQTPIQGVIEVDKDLALMVGKNITLTIAHRGFDNSNFLIRKVEHDFSAGRSTLTIIYSTRFNQDLVGDLLQQSRQLQEMGTDDAITFQKYLQAKDVLIVKTYVTVDKRANAGSYYGSSFYGSTYYGVPNTGAFESVLSEAQIKMIDNGIESMLRIVGQITTVPNTIANTNCYIALGNDDSPINFSDIIINNEIARIQADVGFPNVAVDYEFTIEFTISDSDLSSGIIKNIGVLNNSSLGELWIAGVLSEAVNKAPDEDLLITIRTTFESSKSYIQNFGINLIRDLVTGNSTDYLDDTGAFVEIITSPVYREAMDTDYPQITNANDRLRWAMGLSAADILANSLNGKTYNGVDLYDALSGGNQVFDGQVASLDVDILTDEPQTIEVIIEVDRE